MSTLVCPDCDGSGLVRRRPANAIWLVPCETCGGTGEVTADDSDDET